MVEETPDWSHILFPIEDDLGRCGMFLADFAMSDLIQASDFFISLQGWEYALDFPTKYYGYKSKTSFVRRRKWIRKRKFIGFDMWAQVRDEHLKKQNKQGVYLLINFFK